MLDFKVRRNVEGKIEHVFFEKSMTNKKVIQMKSAMAIKSKIATLSQEIIRRLMNTSRSVEKEEKMTIVKLFMKKLMASGYDRKMRETILKSGLRGFFKKVEREEAGGRRVNQQAWVESEKREVDKL